MYKRSTENTLALAPASTSLDWRQRDNNAGAHGTSASTSLNWRQRDNTAGAHSSQSNTLSSVAPNASAQRFWSHNEKAVNSDEASIGRILNSFDKFSSLPKMSDAEEKQNQRYYTFCSITLNKVRNGSKNVILSVLANQLQTLASKSIFPNIVVINQVLKMLGEANQFTLAKKLFQLSQHKAVFNVITCNTFIEVANSNRNPNAAKLAFDLAIKAKIDDAYTYTSYIRAAHQGGGFGDAQRAYELAVNSQKTNAYVHNAYIQAATHNNNFAEAHKAYLIAVASGEADTFTYTVMIKMAWLDKQFDLATEVMFKAIETNNANEYTYVTHLTGLIGYDLNAAEMFFDTTKRTNSANAATCTIMIKTVALSQDFALAAKILEYAVEHGFDDTMFYNSYINVTGENGHLDLAIDAYNRAVDEDRADVKLRDTIYSVVNRFGTPNDLQKIHNDSDSASTADYSHSL